MGQREVCITFRQDWGCHKTGGDWGEFADDTAEGGWSSNAFVMYVRVRRMTGDSCHSSCQERTGVRGSQDKDLNGCRRAGDSGLSWGSGCGGVVQSGSKPQVMRKRGGEGRVDPPFLYTVLLKKRAVSRK